MPATVSHTARTFPFGEEMAAQHAGGAYSTRYKFNGKELDPETGYYYYGARYYDPVVSRWLSVDPLAEKYPGLSPYNYTANNPVRMFDPNGKGPEDIIILGTNFSSIRIKTDAVHSVINLEDYNLYWDFFGNHTIDLEEIKPDVIGINIGVTATFGYSKTRGFNLLWKTRGEKEEDKYFPELHYYSGKGFALDASANGSVGLIFAWALKPDGSKSPDNFVANGYNWTGYFWSINFSAGEALASGGLSIFTSQDPFQPRKGNAWFGFELAWTPGISLTGGLGKMKKLRPLLKLFDRTNNLSELYKIFKNKSVTKSYYYLLYGNGSDYLPNTGSNVSGWHILNPIDPKDN